MPGLVDAHSHGRGMSPIQKGVKNDFLENALFDWAYMPCCRPSCAREWPAYHHIRTGCTLLHHNGFDDDGRRGASRAHTAIRGLPRLGIRLAFSPGVRDETKLALDENAFFETLPPDLRDGPPVVFYDKGARRRPTSASSRTHEPTTTTRPRILLSPSLGARSHRGFAPQACKADEPAG